MKWLFFLQSINQILVERSLASRNQAILLASSGGQDSTCLFQAISTLCPYWEWSLAVVSCDHGWFGSKSKSCCSQVGQLVWHNKKSIIKALFQIKLLVRLKLVLGGMNLLLVLGELIATHLFLQVILLVIAPKRCFIQLYEEVAKRDFNPFLGKESLFLECILLVPCWLLLDQLPL